MELNGKLLAASIEQRLSVRVQNLAKRIGRPPVLVTLQVGLDPASTTYVQMKAKACERVGMRSKQVHLTDAAALTTSDVIRIVETYRQDSEVDGILLQHPLPAHIDERACFEAIGEEKDVDGVTTANYGRMAMGLPAFVAATPAGMMRLLNHYQIALEGRHAVIVGRSPILGKPIAALLLNQNATVTVCHSKTNHLVELIQQADIVVGAVGKPHFIKDNWLKDGAVIIDAGYHPALQVGDIELTSIKSRALAYTPVPGGVGPMTIAMLMEQTVIAAEKKCLPGSN